MALTLEEKKERQRLRHKAWRDRTNYVERAKDKYQAYQQSDAGKAARRRYLQSDKGKASSAKSNRSYLYQKNFGITVEEYDHLLTEQQHRCAGCGKHQDELSKRLAVDHCHNSGRVRGLLCVNCNTALGKAFDNPVILQNLIAYLGSS